MVFREEDALYPISPYAVARVSQEMLSKVYIKSYGLDIVMTRSFNHIGPGQKEIFVIASFAKRLVEMKKGKEHLQVNDGGYIADSGFCGCEGCGQGL